MALHEILTRKRVELGISIDEIVKRSGVAKGTVSKIMSGNTPNPQIESLKAIAYALGLTLDDLDENPVKATAPALSREAMNLARIYDELDSHSQRIIYTLIQMEAEREKPQQLPTGIRPIGELPMYRIPYLGEAKCDGSIETKLAAKQERRELEAEAENTPVE